jgi:Xaa-Pro dipeptidase
MNPQGEIAAMLTAAKLDGWLFYDFRYSDPIAYRILGLSEQVFSTRRWFYFIPAMGEPSGLVSAVEPHRLDALGSPVAVYRSHAEMVSALQKVLAGKRRVAMDYSPNCAIPYVSRVDAGTVEMVRALGIDVLSAANLIQRLEATLGVDQLEGHRRAARKLRQIIDETFAYAGRSLSAGERLGELQLRDFVLDRLQAHGLVTSDPPIVAANAHSAEPHFAPGDRRETPLRQGDLLLLDLWGKETGPDSIYADLTWIGCAGERVPDEYARVFSIVASARDATVELIKKRVEAGLPVSGAEGDRAARRMIEQAGYGEFFVHRTGHSIGREVHGNGANLDSLETQDDRELIDATCFSVEPGIYLPGRFGIRSELDMTIEHGVAEVSAGAIQYEIVPFLARTGL